MFGQSKIFFCATKAETATPKKTPFVEFAASSTADATLKATSTVLVRMVAITRMTDGGDASMPLEGSLSIPLEGSDGSSAGAAVGAAVGTAVGAAVGAAVT